MKPTVLFPIVVLVFTLFASVSTSAGEKWRSPPQAIPVSGVAAPLLALPGSAKPMSPLLRKVRSYCRRDCEICRNDCYGRFRVYCQGYSCRQHFVLCMRGCWNNICRYC